MWLEWQAALLIAAGLLAVGVGTRRSDGRLRPAGVGPPPRRSDGRLGAAGAVAREAALVLALYAFWRLVMTFRSTRLDEGLAHGHTVYDIETWLHIGNEASMADWLVAHPTVARLANDFYATVHVPALIAFLVWLFWRHRAHYP